MTPIVIYTGASVKTGGVGLNLTGAETVVHYDVWWNIAVQNQATDRSHRIGQKKKLQVFRIIAKDTIEERILEIQKKKGIVFDQTIISDVNLINKLNLDDLIKLFE